jgi:DNA-binding transcriptional LysR family regulator
VARAAAGRSGEPPPGGVSLTAADPSTHQLRLFLALAQDLHFGRAAKRMFISQPALSRQIIALERRVGVGLVRRSTRRVELTPAGRALLPEARAVVDAVDRLSEVIRSHSRRMCGRLRVGFIGAEAAMPYARRILAEFRRRHPESEIEMRSLDLVNQVQALVSGEVDAAFLRQPLPAGIRTLQLASEPRVVCLPAGDPLTARSGEPLTLADFADRVFVDIPGDAVRGWWDHWTVNPRPDGTPVRYGPVVTDMESLLLAVANGQGIAFLPAAAREFYPRPGIVYAEVRGLSPCTAALAWLAEHGEDTEVAALRAAARAVLRTTGPGR